MKVSAGQHSFLKAKILFQTHMVVSGMKFPAVVKLSFLFVGGCKQNLLLVLGDTYNSLPYGQLLLGIFLQYSSSLLQAEQGNLSQSAKGESHAA